MASPHLLGMKQLSRLPVSLGLVAPLLVACHPRTLSRGAGFERGCPGRSLQPGDSHCKPLSGPWISIQGTLFFSFFDEK